MSRKIRIIVISVVGYLITITLVGIFFALISLWSVKQGAFSSARITAIVSRGALYPHTKLWGRHSVWKLTDDVMAIVQLSPNIHEQVLLTSQYLQTGQPIKTSEITSIETTITYTIDHLKLIEENLQHQGSIKQYFFSTLPISQKETVDLVSQVSFVLQLTQAVVPELRDSIDSPEPKNYLILFQNNMELRPTGGFMGSYAQVRLEKNAPVVLEVQDIYVPDGQLPDHVEPPVPIQEAFQQGFWKLRDANWHPDFEKSANNVEWFFEEAMETQVDGVIAVNFSTIQQLLSVLGPIYIPDFQQHIQPEDLYIFLQHQVESDFFSGSTKKKDVLSSITRQLRSQLQQTTLNQKRDLLQILVQEMHSKNIQFHFDHPNTQFSLSQLDVTGQLQMSDCGQSCIQDYFSVFEANLGVNKSNCCVERSIVIDKSYQDSHVFSTILIEWNNLGPSKDLEKVAGDYKSYVRVYAPQNTQVTELIIDGVPYEQYVQHHKNSGSFSPITSSQLSVSTVQNLTEIGFWILIPELQTQQVLIETETTDLQPTILSIQKQSGTISSFNNLKMNFQGNTVFESQIDKDLTLQLNNL